MIKVLCIATLLLCSAVSSAQNTFPATGNVGIGTASPAGDLDVYNAYFSHGYKFLDNVLTNSSVGFFNPIAMAVRQGKKLYADEEFTQGVNSIGLYDNHSSGLLTISRSNTIVGLPNSSGFGLVFTHNGTGTAPGLGGFRQTISSGMNKTFVQIFRAKLPVGYQFNVASNSVGTGGSNYWLSNNAGSGKWEWYVRVVQCGNGGTFSSSGYVYVSGSPAPTATSPLIWYMASCTVFDVTNVNTYSGNYVLNQNASDQNASLRISGNGIIGGNVLIGKTTQTNPAYKLDVNGNIRANKIVVNTTGADYVFDSAHHLISLDSLYDFVKINHHLPGIDPALKMQDEGINLADAYAKLLEKTEELTLYIIELNKKIELKDKEVKALKERDASVLGIKKCHDMDEQ